MKKLSISYGFGTYKGKREENQDASLIYEGESIWTFAMADGIGGYSFGKETAEMTLCALKSELEALEEHSIEYLYSLLQRKYEQINAYIYNLASSKSIKMGTTISMLNFIGDELLLSNTGDTGIYRIRENSIKTLSKLHNVAAEEYEKGKITLEEYKNHRHKNILTRCIGLESEVHPFFLIDKVVQGDRYIICTDGIHNFVDEDFVLSIFSLEGNIQNKLLDDLCTCTIKNALKKGSEDNLSIIAIKIN